MQQITKEFLLEEAREADWLKLDECPVFTGLYIIQQRKLHDSGYRLLHIIGHTKEFDLYLLSSGSDVIDFNSYWSKIMLEDLSIDINKNGVIHIWSRRKSFKCTGSLSTCSFDIVNR